MATKKSEQRIEISIADQRLNLIGGSVPLRSYSISTSRFGTGTKAQSMKTPTGRFQVAAKIGEGMPLTTIFKSRRPLPPGSEPAPDDDAIMARILWLDGLGRRNANTRARYIYIHGTNHETEIGTPASHGCVRMRNKDVAELFDLVEVGTPVFIKHR